MTLVEDSFKLHELLLMLERWLVLSQLRQNLDKKDKKKKRKKDKKDRKGDKEKRKEKKHKRRSSSSEEEDSKKHRYGMRLRHNQNMLYVFSTICDLCV